MLIPLADGCFIGTRIRDVFILSVPTKCPKCNVSLWGERTASVSLLKWICITDMLLWNLYCWLCNTEYHGDVINNNYFHSWAHQFFFDNIWPLAPPHLESDIIHVEWCFIYGGLSPASLTYMIDVKVTINLPEIPSSVIHQERIIYLTMVKSHLICHCKPNVLLCRCN